MKVQEIYENYTKEMPSAVYDPLFDLDHNSPPTQEDFMNFVELAQKLWNYTFPKSSISYDEEENRLVGSVGLICEVYLDTTLYYENNKVKLHWAVYPDEQVIIIAE